MAEETVVIYNETCPICSREIALYRDRAVAAEAPLRFETLSGQGAKAFGLSADDAARRLHVVHEGRLLRGIEAFATLWRLTPGFDWLGRFVMLPVIRQLAHLVYEYAAAPILYRMHLRRVRRGG